MKLYLLATHELIKWKKSNCNKVTKGNQSRLMSLVLTEDEEIRQRRNCAIFLLLICYNAESENKHYIQTNSINKYTLQVAYVSFGLPSNLAFL